jgi:uncharacterized membrane protein YdfJ with MMPL/SSD domain
VAVALWLAVAVVLAVAVAKKAVWRVSMTLPGISGKGSQSAANVRHRGGMADRGGVGVSAVAMVVAIW